jgi:hypothetical protein
LVNYQWKPYFFGLDTVRWNKAQWLNFVVLTYLEFTICPQLKFDSNTKGRIINDLAVQWIWFRKYYFRISRGEKLKEISWKEIENHKYQEEETPPSNELCNIHSVFSMKHELFEKMIHIEQYEKMNFRKPQWYVFNFSSSRLKLEKDFIFRLTPKDIGQLYSKYYLIDISQVDVEIYLEFETHLAPLCKLNNLLDVTLFAKQIFDISQTEGELLYIWIILHHRWFVHREITNHHSYEKKFLNNKIKDFTPENWFNRHPYRGFFRSGWEVEGYLKSEEDALEKMEKCMKLEKRNGLVIEYFWVTRSDHWEEFINTGIYNCETGKFLNTRLKLMYQDDSQVNLIVAAAFDKNLEKSRILIRRPICNEGNPSSPEFVGLLKFLNPILAKHKVLNKTMDFVKDHNYNLEARSRLWFLVNFFTLEKGVYSWLGYYRYIYWRLKLEEVKMNKIPMIEMNQNLKEGNNGTYFENYDRQEIEEKSRWFNKLVCRKKRRKFFEGLDVFNKEETHRMLKMIALGLY